MRKLNVLSVATVLLLLGVSVYLVYRVSTNYGGYREVVKLSEEFYNEDLQPEKLDEKIVTVREQLGSSPNPPLQLLLFDLLLFKSYYYPDTSSEPLGEGLELGQELYRKLDAVRGPIGAQLAFGYLYAGLPTKLPGWRTEVAARDPQYRPQLSLLTFYGYVMSDDLAGAQQLADSEAKENGQNLETRAMLAAVYQSLGFEHESRQFALDENQLGDIGSNLREAYAQFLLESGKYVEAEGMLRKNMEDLPGDPERSLELALGVSMTRGIDDAEVQRLLETAARSTRDPRTVAGATALCLSSGYELDGNTASAERLLALAGQSGDDFHVQLALAELSRELAQRGVDVGFALSADLTAGTGIEDPVGLARRLLTRADTPVRLQNAHLLLALALTESARGRTEPRQVLAEAVRHFAAALGAGEGLDVLETDRIPAYDLFLLDPSVREMREISVDFDHDIHHAVVDLLNRRRTMFSDVVKLPAIEYAR